VDKPHPHTGQKAVQQRSTAANSLLNVYGIIHR
jgi:hypothetical protein